MFTDTNTKSNSEFGCPSFEVDSHLLDFNEYTYGMHPSKTFEYRAIFHWLSEELEKMIFVYEKEYGLELKVNLSLTEDGEKVSERNNFNHYYSPYSSMMESFSKAIDKKFHNDWGELRVNEIVTKLMTYADDENQLFVWEDNGIIQTHDETSLSLFIHTSSMIGWAIKIFEEEYGLRFSAKFELSNTLKNKKLN